MLTRLLTNLDDIDACLLSAEGQVMGGEGAGNIALYPVSYTHLTLPTILLV